MYEKKLYKRILTVSLLNIWNNTGYYCTIRCVLLYLKYYKEALMLCKENFHSFFKLRKNTLNNNYVMLCYVNKFMDTIFSL